MLTGVLGTSIVSALVYGAGFCHRRPSLARVVINTAATALLTLWAYLAGGPTLLVLALAFSTLGDAFLGASEERYLLPGMAAFFTAHTLYVVLFSFYIAAFWSLLGQESGAGIIIAHIALTLGGVVFIGFMLKSIDPAMRIPVIAYAAIILCMGNAALRLDDTLIWAKIGALAFILSDVILTVELFRIKSNAPIKRLTSPLIWGFYYGGQALIAYAFIS